MKTNWIATTGLLFTLVTGTFAQTAPATGQMPGASVHKANISPAPTQPLAINSDRKAERKARLAAMTPDERSAFKADRKTKKAAKIAAMTPEQRQQYEARKAEKKAGRRKLK